MIAVIKTGGKQYVVKPGDVLNVEKLDLEAGAQVTLDAMLTAEGEKVEIGMPTLSSKVTAEVMEQGRAKKISVVKYKPKVRYTRRVGHRQPFTKIKIVSIL